MPERASDLTLIRPAARWKALDLGQLWEYRELLYFLTWRDVKVRYKQTLLGAAWAIMQPAMFSIVFTFVLDRFARFSAGDAPYLLFAYTGMLPWTFFSGAITSAGHSVTQAERVVTKVYFPRLAIPFAAVGASLVDLALGSVVLVGLLIWYGVVPTWQLLLAPLAIGLLTVAALGIGSLLSALMVAYRDIRYVMPFLIQLLLFATPSIYMDTSHPPVAATTSVESPAIPAAAPAGPPETGIAPHGLLDLHPLDGAIAFFRAAVLGGPIPWRRAAYAAVLIAILFCAGTAYFRRVEDAFADII